MELKIISDGSPMGTTVVNAETGEELVGVIAIEWEHQLGIDRPVCTLRLAKVRAELLATGIQ